MPAASATTINRHPGMLRPVGVLALLALLSLAGAAAASAGTRGAVVEVKTVKVGAPGNRSAAIVPFTDAIYRSCAKAPKTSRGCQRVGGVGYRYGIGRLEITDRQWVKFLNTADPTGRDPHHLYDPTEDSAGWPRFGEIDFTSKARRRHHYSVPYLQWADKPYGFANFLRAARFVNSMFNGKLLSKRASSAGGFQYLTYKVRLSSQTERGMYDLARHKRSGARRAQRSGFVVPSQNEWIKAAYFDPSGGGTYSYWKYPTNPGVFGDGTATAPSPTTLDPTNGDVTNSATQPLATYHASGLAAPSWCPAQVSASNCSSVNPFGLDPTTYADLYQGSVSTVGQAKTTSPWGTLDQGGNVVEWTDTITPPPSGRPDGRVWRRLHGGIANAPAYQLWLSAVGLQPQENPFYDFTYPWLGFRIGVIGDLHPGRS